MSFLMITLKFMLQPDLQSRSEQWPFCRNRVLITRYRIQCCHSVPSFFGIMSPVSSHLVVRACIKDCIRGCIKGYIKGCIRACIKGCIRGCISTGPTAQVQTHGTATLWMPAVRVRATTDDRPTAGSNKRPISHVTGPLTRFFQSRNAVRPDAWNCCI